MSPSGSYRRKMKLGASKTGSKGNSIFFEAGSEADPFIVDGNGKMLTMSYRSNDDTGNGKITVGVFGNYSGGVVLNGGTYKPTGIAVGKSSTYTGYLKLDNGAKLETVTTNSVWAYNNWIAFGKLVIDGGSEVKFGNTATSGANFLIGGGNSVAVPGAHGECHVLNGTLVNRGHVVIGYFGESSGGTGYAYMEVDGGLVTNKTGNVDIGEEGAPGDRSILRIKSGTFAANGPLRIGRGSSGALFMDGGVLDVSRDVMTMASYNAQSGEDCALVMSNGVVKTQTLQYGNGAADATVLFDGGTLQAAQSGTLVKAHSRLAVSVGPRGGVIDANGKAVAIEEELSGVGGVTFKGRGSVTLAPGNTYAGVTTVEIGTTVHVASADEIGSGLAVTVPEEAPADCVYALLAIDGAGTFDASVLTGVVPPANATLRLSVDAKSVLCIYGNPQNTWVGGASGSLSDNANWSLGFVPTSGENCVIGNATAATLTVGGAFAPASITFPPDTALVTVSCPGAISGIEAITNRSAVSQVFSCAVGFVGALGEGCVVSNCTLAADCNVAALNVYGIFKPSTGGRFCTCTMHDGSTIDLSGMTTALPLFSAGCSELVKFVAGSTASVDVGGRNAKNGDCLFTWPMDAIITRPEKFVIRSNGTLLGGKTLVADECESGHGLYVASANKERFRAMVWNLAHFSHREGMEGSDYNPNIKPEESDRWAREYRAKIARNRPDFLGICEYDPEFDTGGRETQEALQLAQFPTRNIGPENVFPSNALFSPRFRCDSYNVVDYESRKQKTYFIDSILRLKGREVHVVVTHLDWAEKTGGGLFKEDQVTELIRYFENAPYVVIMGDFNIWNSQPEIFDPFKDAGYTVVNEDTETVESIKDNMVVKGLEVKHAYLDDLYFTLSDHRILVCDFAFKPSGSYITIR